MGISRGTNCSVLAAAKPIQFHSVCNGGGGKGKAVLQGRVRLVIGSAAPQNMSGNVPQNEGRVTAIRNNSYRRDRDSQRSPKQAEEVFKVLTALVSFVTAVFLHRGLPVLISTVREVRAPEGMSPDLVVEPPCRIHEEKGG